MFDIGANVGMHTQVFLALGARVIAVEPAPAAASRLREIKSNKLTVLPCAISGRLGWATLHVGSDTCFSTISEDWMKHAGERIGNWKEAIEVRTETLDNLIATYGQPDFIKIDVEGYEAEVLDGLSSIPCPMSFEFNSEWMEPTWNCLEKPCFPPDAEFNFALENKVQLREWVNRDCLKRVLRGVAGDILVRKQKAPTPRQGKGSFVSV